MGKAATRRRLAAKLPKLRTLFNVASKPWVPLGHEKPSPGLETVAAKFGPPKYTEADQAANPDKPYTRVVKDVLPQGRWHLGFGDGGKANWWTVTAETLAGIERNFKLAQSHGVAANLGKEHGDPETGLIHPDDLIAPIDAAAVVDGTLWIAAYVTPEQAAYLSNPARKVSIGVMEPYFDGAGRKYPIQLVHVAVTDQPVIPGQGPFRKLASPTGGSKMDFPVLLETINSFLEALGFAALPDDTTEENLIDRLVGVKAAMGDSAAPSDGGGEPEGEPVDPTMPDPMANLMSKRNPNMKALATLRSEIDSKFTALSGKIDALLAEKTQTAKDAFEQKLENICKAGLPAARKEFYLSRGAKLNWDMELLDAAANEKGVDMGRVVKTLANGQPQSLPSDGPAPATEQDAIDHLKRKGVKDPERFLPRIEPVR